MGARAIVLTGPSGSGKSRMAARLRLPVVNLDDFYRDEDDPQIPRLAPDSFGRRHLNWESPAAWHEDQAITALDRLCTSGSARLPVYSLSQSRRIGEQTLTVDGLFIVEGLFAGRVIGPLHRRGSLAAAVALANSPLLTFVRRMRRDFADRRKPPRDIIRIGIGKLRAERAIVAALIDDGATPMRNRDAERYLRTLTATSA